MDCYLHQGNDGVAVDDAGASSAAARCAFVAHLLRVFGVAARAAAEPQGAPADVLVADGRPPHAHDGEVVVVLSPDAAFAAEHGLTREVVADATAATFGGADAALPDGLRSWYPHCVLHGEAGAAVVSDACGRATWRWLESPGGPCLLVGTELARDLVLIRQGCTAAGRAAASRWGFDFERPDYLFEGLAPAAPAFERMADSWCELLAGLLVVRGAVARRPMLPDGAPGAVVVTGDDDQAAIAAYEHQLEALRSIPLTYFMHPLTRIDVAEQQRLFAGRVVELGLHPDALDAPERYPERLAEQAAWFARRFGHGAAAVRNHGFLNDGYWRHARAWLRAGIAFSSNLPGLDGRLLNGSLLPARLLLDGELCDHWSILTAFGDGMVFALGMSDEDAAARVLELARQVEESGMPGVIVVNLHPENAQRIPCLHRAMHALGERGYVYWTMSECLAWFRDRDMPRDRRRSPGRLARWWARLRPAARQPASGASRRAAG